jgi:membrane-bound inhibitor of C-type lysozyme
MKTKIFLLVPIILVVAGIIYYQIAKQNTSIKATFNCREGKTIKAEFAKEKVNLLLSDGRKIELPQAISASGARYANSDESFVFWNKGNTAFIEEKGTTTFTNCIEATGK